MEELSYSYHKSACMHNRSHYCVGNHKWVNTVYITTTASGELAVPTNLQSTVEICILQCDKQLAILCSCMCVLHVCVMCKVREYANKDNNVQI